MKQMSILIGRPLAMFNLVFFFTQLLNNLKLFPGNVELISDVLEQFDY